MSLRGYDIFIMPPDQVASMRCRVCGAECHIQRDIDGPTNWIAGIAGLHKRHDRFSCPHSGRTWHEQALRLRRAIDDCASESVRRLMLDDLGRLLQAR